jgi:hypothetical protein
MMFEVRWEEAALDELTALWFHADSTMRQKITSTTHQIDQILTVDPYTEGESREEGQRILLVYPLGLLFRVEQDEQTVSVLHVWRFKRHAQ